MRRPELNPTRPVSTPLREQVYVCSVCGKEFTANVAPYGNSNVKALVNNLHVRFWKHAAAEHGYVNPKEPAYYGKFVKVRG